MLDDYANAILVLIIAAAAVTFGLGLLVGWYFL